MYIIKQQKTVERKYLKYKTGKTESLQQSELADNDRSFFDPMAAYLTCLILDWDLQAWWEIVKPFINKYILLSWKDGFYEIKWKWFWKNIE